MKSLKCAGIHCDVTKPDSVKDAFAKVVQKHPVSGKILHIEKHQRTRII
jgi:NAD(P)-dependent dehydrogenase (short-subunit alcohol dehydrogenase family)